VDLTGEPIDGYHGAGKNPRLPDNPAVPEDPVAAGGFALDHTKMRDVLGGLDHENTRIGEDQGGLVEADWSAHAPAGDIISMGFAAHLSVTLAEFLNHNETMLGYCSTGVDNIRTSLSAYLGTDAANSADLETLLG
jgi:hypothetical protein